FDLWGGWYNTPNNIKNIFWCPSGMKERMISSNGLSKDGPNYGYNGYCGYCRGQWGWPTYPEQGMKKISRVREHSKAFLIADVTANVDIRHIFPRYKIYVFGETFSRRHNNGVNFLFVDNHVEWRTWEKIPDPSKDIIFWINYAQ
ncbi:MAG: hypothetical protein NC926_06930, partial [Candidatus Omnitrophica bacterium]|nr:hypothetical protein [Candidatus Omnitrophota bacterium]